MKKIKAALEGKDVWGWAEKIDGTLWMHVDGKTFSHSLEDDDLLVSQSVVADPNVLVSTMPGKITKIAMNSGDEVQEGDVIVVMEAMKMEYSLQAPRRGTIADIDCQVGDQVDLGQILVRLEVEDE